MKIKMLTSIAGADFSVSAGEIVEAAFVGGDAVAKAWIKSGDAIKAPSSEDAANEIAALRDDLDRVTRERDGFSAQIADALAAKASAEAECSGYKAKVEELTAALAAANAPKPAPAQA